MEIVVVALSAVAGSFALRSLPREGAWALVPIAWVWGVAACSTAWRARARPHPAVVGGVALALRLLLVGTPPHLSDDGYRYLWEGLALNHGIDPFSLPPAAIDGLDDALRSRVNHPDLTSIYPPLALWWFRAVASTGTELWHLQLATGAVDVLTAVILARIAPARMSWVYALHPLAVLESASGAHLEALAVAFAAGGLADRRLWPLATAAGAWAKVLPLAWWGPAIRATEPATRVLWTVAALVGGVVLAYPVWGAGSGLWTSWALYARTWEFNGLVYPWIAPWLGSATRPVLLLFGCGAVGVAWARAPSPAVAWLWIAAAFLAFTPTAHPWYGLWVLVPAVALGRPGFALAAVALLGAYGVLSGLDPTTGTWVEPAWLWWVTWVPALAALALGRGLQPLSDDAPTAP